MKRLKEIGILLVGWFILALGVLGLFLPLLQGVLFILIGLAILSTRSKTIQRLLDALETRHPGYHAKIEKWRHRVRGWFKAGKG
jgi:uncharacterized protein